MTKLLGQLGDFSNNGPHPKVLELQQKKVKDGLTPEEEGELSGVFAHRDDTEAVELVKREYLASLGLCETTADEKERLRQIRAEKFARENRNRRELISEDTRDTGPVTKQAGRASAADFYVRHTKGKITAMDRKWYEAGPAKLIDDMVGGMPDSNPIVSKENIQDLPKNEPTDLELYLLSKLPKIDDFEDAKKEDGSLTVLEALNCLRDKVRTKKFMKAVKDSVQRLDSDTQRDEIYVVDAGCGPLPIMAIYAALSSPKVKCTCIELNPTSAKIARKCIEVFGLQDRVEVIEADATTYKSNNGIDVLVSETMHSALTEEMIVPIMGNLAPSVKQDGEVLPSKIIVEAALIPVGDWAHSGRYMRIGENMHNVFDANWKTVVDYTPGQRLENIDFEMDTEGAQNGSYLLFLTSQVTIGLERLKTFESLITNPQSIRETNGDPVLIDVKNGYHPKIKVNYKPGGSLNGSATIH